VHKGGRIEGNDKPEAKGFRGREEILLSAFSDPWHCINGNERTRIRLYVAEEMEDEDEGTKSTQSEPLGGKMPRRLRTRRQANYQE